VKREAVKPGMMVQWTCGMGILYIGKVVALEEKGALVVVELFGGARKWVRVEDLTEKV